MSNVIDFIEQLGRDAQWRHASGAAVEAAMIEAGFAPSVREAVLGEDPSALELLVGARPIICCLINHPAEEESEEEEEDDTDDEQEDEPEEDEDEK